jgi:multicomponent Na+:H+ antiporter subunit D
MILLVVAHQMPPRLSTVLALLTALGVAALCAYLAHAALEAPVLHWFGGWTPATSGKPNVVLGISFLADPASAAVAAFSALIFAASFVFAWGYFDETHSHFEILMLLFLAAIAGFCLTHDLFNLFVWFELMSVAAFALTAYPLGKSSLEGAFNFTITNTLGGFMMLAGIGLLYARTGTLDFTEMGKLVAEIGSDSVLSAGFCLIAAALLTKGAIVPFHMWLSDAHAVAPSPVSVIFSGIMVSVALFALAKIVAQIFINDALVMELVHSLLLWLGAATAIIGGAMAFAQRHLKRLLAFSTIAHLGIMLTAIAAITPAGLAGFVLYLVGHGLVKGTLFMVAGILLALLASADEIVLYGKGRELWPAGLVMALAGLLLGGLPVGLLHGATEIFEVDVGAASIAIVLSTSLTGAAVLRSAARIFIGWSGTPGVEITGPTEREHEKADRTLWLMLTPCVVLLAIAVLPDERLLPFLGDAAARLLQPFGTDTPALPKANASLALYAPVVLTLLLVAVPLLRKRPTRSLSRSLFQFEKLPFRVLQFLHSGLVGDYVVWMIVGVAALALGIAV